MKYDILTPFQEYIRKQLPANTAKTYYGAVVKLFKDIQFNSLKEIDKDWIKEETNRRFKTRNEYSAVKNGLKWLSQFDATLQLPTEEEFKSISIKKRSRSKRPKKVIYLKPTQRKINQISNERLKYAYRLGAISGLRVSELADLEADDITVKDGKIFVRIKKGKGGHGGIVECQADAYMAERLPDFLKEYPEGKIFYSESYMREQAAKLGIECHDLRRIFAITTREELRKEMPAEEANDIVQQRLRHARFSTTKRYLFNRKLKYEYGNSEKDKETANKNKKRVGQPNLEKPKEIEHVADIDKTKFQGIEEKIVTNEAVLTYKQKMHIIEGRGQDFFDKYYPFINEVLTDPDYIFKDKRPHTALVVKKHFDGNKYINIILRLVVPTDDSNYKNSIITMIGINEKRFKSFMKNHAPVYKKG